MAAFVSAKIAVISVASPAKLLKMQRSNLAFSLTDEACNSIYLAGQFKLIYGGVNHVY